MTQEPVVNVPVHLVTGFLGSGKSSLIRGLIRRKPEHENWAVLVNEFGQVGIDQAMFEPQDGVTVKGLPGGCLCCQLAFVLQATLVNLLYRHRPDRLLIEPSGLGHPAGLLDVLRGEAFHGVLVMHDIIAVLDPRRLDDPRSREHDTFRDQLAMADAVALTMTDLATEDQLVAAQAWLDASWPRKKWIRHAPYGELDASLSNGGMAHAEEGARPLPESEAHRRLREQAAGSVLVEGLNGPSFPRPGRPICEQGVSLGYATLGWRWHPDDVFVLDRLSTLLADLPSRLRVKAVLHTDSGWKFYNRSAGTVSLEPTAWRQDSRLEIIAEAGTLPDADRLAIRLAECLGG
ncbi:CobW family GTP-binding protein [Billgrantia gudaonensis]|uniref:GTPase, G3E family n=1 Tax=Billgrantia gudaonensis TaxID=376427 RepID=A0A1G8WTL4_9GAMM|nr:GTP-binding protein [Halomonas gudaonensis]SDJ81493.1 GTPase, G3E family [Halomonas gudaonensis]